MELLPAGSFSVDEWAAAYKAAYSPEMSALLGNNWVARGVQPPSFVEFFDEAFSRITTGDMKVWGVLNSSKEFVGYVTLTRTPEVPQWELGVVIADVESRGTGIGIRAARNVVAEVFEDPEEEWVWAISEVKSEAVENIMERSGFKKFAHFYLLHRDWFEDKWGGNK